MKKILILSIFIALGISCNKKDDDEEQLTLNYENMAGEWNIAKVIKTNGTTVDYVNDCATNKDYMKFFPNADSRNYEYNGACNLSTFNSYGYYFTENRIMNCNYLLYDCRIISLTRTSFTADFDYPRSYGSQNESVKSLIFNRR